MATQEEIDLLRKQLEESQLEVETLKKKLSKNNLSATSGSERSEYTDIDSDASTASANQRYKLKKNPKQKKKPSLKGVLTKHQKLIKSIGDKTLDDGAEAAKIKAIMNTLDSKTIREALKNNDHKNSTMEPNRIEPPNIESNTNCSALVMKEVVISLKDSFKNQFSGKPGDDVESLLHTAGQLAQDHDLSKTQFFTLLRSRVAMGSTLYTELRLHEDIGSSLVQLYAELLPVYGKQYNYVASLNKLHSYKPPPNALPNQVFATVKSLATELANSANSSHKEDFIYSHCKEKIMSLYPGISQTLLEKESKEKHRNTATFSRIFLTTAPVPTAKKFPVKESVYEIQELENLGRSEDNKINVVKLSEEIARKLSGKCYKCGNSSSQAPHFGRECELYRGCSLAYYLCSKCKQAVHLPRDCKATIEEVNLNLEDHLTFQLLTSDCEEDSKNLE